LESFTKCVKLRRAARREASIVARLATPSNRNCSRGMQEAQIELGQ